MNKELQLFFFKKKKIRFSFTDFIFILCLPVEVKEVCILLLFWGVEGCFQDSELFIFFLGQDITGLQRLKIVKSGEFRCHVLSFVKFFFFCISCPLGQAQLFCSLEAFVLSLFMIAVFC